METITIQKAWAEGLLEYVKRTEEYLKAEDDSDKLIVLFEAGVPQMVGYAASLDSYLEKLKEI